MSKAGRPKKNSAGLPDWFDIEKYRQTKAFGAAEWFQQLSFRSTLHEFLAPEMPWPFDEKPWCFGADWMNLLKADPCITIDRVEAVRLKEEDGIFKQEREKSCKIFMMDRMAISKHSGEGVRTITYGDIRRAAFLLNLFFDGMADDVEEQEREKLWLEQNNKPFNDGGFGNHAIFTRVDLSLPDAILKKSFADYLKAQRSNAKEAASPFFKNQDFAVWYSCGVLPYVDLCLWEEESGQTFRMSAFADALNTITDEDVASEDACRKTSKALAEKLMDERTIRMLHYQAVKEQSESHKKSGKLFVR